MCYSLKDRRRAANLLKALTLLNLGIALGYVGYWFVDLRDYWRNDFTAFYTGSLLVWDGFGTRLYDYALQASKQQAILGTKQLGGLLAFNYPPHLALLLTPVAVLPLRAAYIVWSALQLFLVVVLCVKIERYLGRKGISAEVNLAVVAAVLALPSMIVSLILGTLSIPMLIAYIGYGQAFEERDDTRAGLWLSLMSFKPQLAVTPALILLMARRWRGIMVALLIVVAIVVLTSAALGYQIWWEFAQAVLRTFSGDAALAVNPKAMHNLRGSLTRLLGTNADLRVDQLSRAGFVGSILGIGVLWWYGASTRRDPNVLMALGLLLGILFGLHVNPQDSLLVVASVLVFYAYLHRMNHRSLAYSAYLLCSPVLLLVTDRVLGGMLGIQATVPVMAALSLWIFTVWLTSQPTTEPSNL